MTERQRIVVIRNLRVRRRELINKKRQVLLGAVARRREAGEVVGRLDGVQEERGAQHGCYGLRDGVRASPVISRAASSPDTWERSTAPPQPQRSEAATKWLARERGALVQLQKCCGPANTA